MNNSFPKSVELTNKALKKKVVIITGAAQGIGRSLAMILAGLNANVVIADISDNGEKVAVEIKNNSGIASFFKIDIANEKEIEYLIKNIIEVYGRVDILINNAIVCPVSSIEDMDVQTWDRTIAVNLRGPFLLIKKLIPKFKEKNEGIIVNLVSTGGSPPPEVGQAFMSAYCSSKGGLAALTLSIAPELEINNIKVVGIWVGMTDTPGGNKAFKALAPLLGIPYSQFEEAIIPSEHVATAIAYILSNIDEYKGSIVELDRLISELGLISKSASVGEVPSTPIRPDTVKKADIDVIYDQLVENARNLAKVLEEINESFNQLPIFVRPMAKRGFKKKAGADIAIWLRSIEEMIEHQKTWSKAFKHNDKETLKVIQGEFVKNYHSLVLSLNRLKLYIEEVPIETSKFTKDEFLIREVTLISNRQSALVKSLLFNLEILYELLN